MHADSFTQRWAQLPGLSKNALTGFNQRLYLFYFSLAAPECIGRESMRTLTESKT
jgi:hypothetical protein